MLMDDRDVDLNEAIRALREAALRHAGDRLRAQDAGLQDLLDGLAARRERNAEAILDAWEDAPRATRSPDPEAMALKDAFSRVRAAIAEDQDGVLADECLTIETRAFNAVQAARKHKHPSALDRALLAAHEDIADAMNALQPFLPDDR
jgi:hypothetical protein